MATSAISSLKRQKLHQLRRQDQCLQYIIQQQQEDFRAAFTSSQCLPSAWIVDVLAQVGIWYEKPTAARAGDFEAPAVPTQSLDNDKVPELLSAQAGSRLMRGLSLYRHKCNFTTKKANGCEHHVTEAAVGKHDYPTARRSRAMSCSHGFLVTARVAIVLPQIQIPAKA